MQRISGAGNVNGMFVTEDAAESRAPTEITDTWLNDVQEELMAVVEGVGLSASANDRTQLRQAITRMIQAAERAVIINNAALAPAVAGTGKAVYWDAANSRFDLAVADGTVKQYCVGFADVAAGNVYAFGDGPIFAGLTPGARYFLDTQTAGLITAVQPQNSVFVGVAKSTTELLVDIDAVAGISGTDIQAQTYTAFTTAGATGAYTLTPNPAITGYNANQRFRVKFHVGGNGADKINVCAKGDKSIKQYDSTGAKVAPVIVANQLADIEYDGVDFVILDPLPAPVVTSASDPTYTDNSSKGASTGWVRGAISAIFIALGFVASLAANGYIKFPSLLGGFVIQWGLSGSVSANASLAVSFPVMFPNACFAVAPVRNSTSAANQYGWSINTPTTSGFTLYNENTAATPFYWIAVGN
jgi:hypothetical protein